MRVIFFDHIRFKMFPFAVLLLASTCDNQVQLNGTFFESTLGIFYGRATGITSYLEYGTETLVEWTHPTVPLQTFFTNNLYWSIDTIDQSSPYKTMTIRYCSVTTCNRCGPVLVMSAAYEYLTNASSFLNEHVNLYDVGDTHLVEDNIMVQSLSGPEDNFRFYIRANVDDGDIAHGQYLPVRLLSSLNETCSQMTGAQLRGSTCGTGEPVLFSVRLLPQTPPPMLPSPTSPPPMLPSPVFPPPMLPPTEPPGTSQSLWWVYLVIGLAVVAIVVVFVVLKPHLN